MRDTFILKKIGNNIKYTRVKHKNLTQEYVADQLGITTRALSNIENGKCDISILRLNQLSKIFEISLLNLIVNEDQQIEVLLYKELEEHLSMGDTNMRFKKLIRLYELSVLIQNRIAELMKTTIKNQS